MSTTPFAYRDCNWQKIPKFFLAIEKEYDRLEAMGLRKDERGPPVDMTREDGIDKNCAQLGKPREFFKYYKTIIGYIK